MWNFLVQGIDFGIGLKLNKLKIEFSLSHVFTGEVCRFSRLVKKGIAQAAMPFFLSFGFFWFKSAP
jgi:hypothetical protein